jgi:phosphoserine phosphatase
MSNLHVFDMDGTLLQGSACLELSRHMGKLDQVEAMEEAWGRGEIGHVAFYELLLELWQGLDDADVPGIVARSPWLEGIREVCRDIGNRGEHSCVVSMSPQFFADHLLEWGFHRVHGAGVHPERPLLAADVLSPEGKVEIVRDLLDRYGLGIEDAVAYGDSASDLPLFRFLPNTVAVNASERLREVAAAVYDGTDLRQAYALGRSLLGKAGYRPPAMSPGGRREK